MYTVPKPTLGEVSAIAIHSPQPEHSAAYYKQLGYAEIVRGPSWILLSDTALLVLLIQHPNPLIAQLYYSKEPEKVVAEMQARGISFTANSSNGITFYSAQSPDGMPVSIINHVEGVQPPTGNTMLTLPQEDYLKPELYANKVCGLYGEFCHPVKQLDTSIAFWEKLGFVILTKFESPYPWAIISDGSSVIGLHQTDHFSDPAITYFGSDMTSRIEALKKAGITSHIEMGPTNAVLKTPEEQYINLFDFGSGG